MLRLCGCFLLAGLASLHAERVAVLVRLGADLKPDVDWSGHIDPAPLRLEGWQFDSRDRVDGARWHCVTRRETYWDTPYEKSMKPTSQREKVTVKGLVLEYDSAGAIPRLATAHGAFPATPGAYLDGRVTVEPTPVLAWLTQGADAEDYPATLLSRANIVWRAWTAYDASAGDRLFVQRGDAPPQLVVGPGADLFRASLAQDRNGRIWVFWSAQLEGDFELYGRAWDGNRWGSTTRLTQAPGPDIYHAAVTDAAGTLHLAWMSARSGQFDIYWRSFNGRRWSPETRVSDSPAHDWQPALAAAPDGRVALVWDTYARSHYDLVLSEFRSGAWGPPRYLTSSPAFEARASAQYDARNRLWLAWEEGDANWGKDYGMSIEDLGRGLMVRRQVRVGVFDGARLLQPAALPATALPEDLRQAMVEPRLALDPQGRPWLAFRYRVNLPRARGESANRAEWRLGLTMLDAGRWVSVREAANAPGRIDAAPALLVRPGAVEVTFPSDRRRWPLGEPGHYDLARATLPLPPASAEPALSDYQPPNEPAATVHSREAEDIARVRAWRAQVGARQFRIVRGDIHRHTDVSWDGNRDGSLHDAYRYALDVAGFDFLGVCDHQAGQMIAYNWWMIQKAADLFFIPGRFAPLYSYERSLPYPNGHRNVLFARRGRPVLEIPDAEQKGLEGAARLYDYLRRFSGLTTSHTSATGAGTDWRDSSEDLEPVVEIYQGYRRNYEGPGTPRAPQGGEDAKFAAGFVWNAWRKGIKLGVQSSSDHVSTHISYAALYVDEISREAILAAIRARRTYAATDNLILDVRMGEHFMGESFTAPAAPPLEARVRATAPIKRIDVVRNNRVVYSAPGQGPDANITYTDREPASGAAWYYVRVEQIDGQLAWSSPLWVTFR